jgi:hypothetical protein
LFSQSIRFPSDRIEKEWTTYLAEAYQKSPVRTLEVMSRLEPVRRRAAANQIVSAMLTLYNGDFDAPSTPWPSMRIPATLVPIGAQRAWNALLEAEREHRDGLGQAPVQARVDSRRRSI